MADATVTRVQVRAALSIDTVLDRVRAWLPLAAVVGMFFAVSTTYNATVPLYESPDEAAHALYAGIIVERGELPRFETEFEYESWQPPLYYAVGAAALKLMALDPPPVLKTNPAFPQYEVNNYIHTASEDFPYTEQVLAVHVLRGISTLFSIGTIIVIYLTALVLFPGRKLLAFTAASTAGLIPQFAYISGMVNNDAASIFFASAVAYFGIRLLGENRQVWVVGAALALSLCALTKLTAVLAGVIPVGAVLLMSQPWSTKSKHLALLAIAPLALAGWFYLRSLILWGSLYPAHLFWPHQTFPIWDETYRTEFVDLLRESFWYRGGSMLLRLAPPWYDLLDVVSILALGGVIATFCQERLSQLERRGLLLLSVLPFLVLAALLYIGVTQAYQNQGRYLFVAMPAFAILLPLGLSALFSLKGKDSPVILALPALLLALNLGIFATTLPRTY